MAVSEVVVNKLSLDRWARVLGVDPLHFNQIEVTTIRTVGCSNPWKQHAWQEHNQVGRDDVAEAISQAESEIERYLKQRVLPTWEVDERHPTIQPGIPDLYNISNLSLRGGRQGIRLDWSHYISGGIEARTLIEAGATIVYTDEDGDGFAETATITVATTVTEECEIALYYPGEGGANEWEIRPLRSVVIAAGVATIRAWRYQLVLPELMMNTLVPEPVDGLDNALFLTTVDIYRHFNDPQQMATLLWAPIPNLCNCGSATCQVCVFNAQTGCLLARDNRNSIVTYASANWNATTEVFDSAALVEQRQPDNLRLWYYAGHQDQKRTCPRLEMDSDLERAITYYSLTILDRPLCGCNNLEAAVRKWTGEFNLQMSNPTSSMSYQVGQQILDNPFGGSRGAMEAWKIVNQDGRRVGQAALL